MLARSIHILQKLLALACVALFAISATAQTSSPRINSYQCTIYCCYIAGDLPQWLRTTQQMERDYRKNPSDALLTSIIESQYGYIAWAINKGQEQEASQAIESALNHADNYLGRHPNEARIIALKSSLLGFKIAISPIKAPVLGTKAISLINNALKIEPNNPWVMLEKANDELYIPAILGGDSRSALSRYQKCIAILEAQHIPCSWQILNARINMAYCYIKLKEYNKAMAVYNGILSKEPSFDWVRNHLIPSLKRKMGGK